MSNQFPHGNQPNRGNAFYGLDPSEPVFSFPTLQTNNDNTDTGYTTDVQTEFTTDFDPNTTYMEHSESDYSTQQPPAKLSSHHHHKPTSPPQQYPNQPSSSSRLPNQPNQPHHPHHPHNHPQQHQLQHQQGGRLPQGYDHPNQPHHHIDEDDYYNRVANGGIKKNAGEQGSMHQYKRSRTNIPTNNPTISLTNPTNPLSTHPHTGPINPHDQSFHLGDAPIEMMMPGDVLNKSLLHTVNIKFDEPILVKNAQDVNPLRSATVDGFDEFLVPIQGIAQKRPVHNQNNNTTTHPTTTTTTGNNNINHNNHTLSNTTNSTLADDSFTNTNLSMLSNQGSIDAMGTSFDNNNKWQNTKQQQQQHTLGSGPSSPSTLSQFHYGINEKGERVMLPNSHNGQMVQNRLPHDDLMTFIPTNQPHSIHTIDPHLHKNHLGGLVSPNVGRRKNDRDGIDQNNGQNEQYHGKFPHHHSITTTNTNISNTPSKFGYPSTAAAMNTNTVQNAIVNNNTDTHLTNDNTINKTNNRSQSMSTTSALLQATRNQHYDANGAPQYSDDMNLYSLHHNTNPHHNLLQHHHHNHNQFTHHNIHQLHPTDTPPHSSNPIDNEILPNGQLLSDYNNDRRVSFGPSRFQNIEPQLSFTTSQNDSSSTSNLSPASPSSISSSSSSAGSSSSSGSAEISKAPNYGFFSSPGDNNSHRRSLNVHNYVNRYNMTPPEIHARNAAKRAARKGEVYLSEDESFNYISAHFDHNFHTASPQTQSNTQNNRELGMRLKYQEYAERTGTHSGPNGSVGPKLNKPLHKMNKMHPNNHNNTSNNQNNDLPADYFLDAVSETHAIGHFGPGGQRTGPYDRVGGGDDDRFFEDEEDLDHNNFDMSIMVDKHGGIISGSRSVSGGVTTHNPGRNQRLEQLHNDMNKNNLQNNPNQAQQNRVNHQEQLVDLVGRPVIDHIKNPFEISSSPIHHQAAQNTTSAFDLPLNMDQFGTPGQSHKKTPPRLPNNTSNQSTDIVVNQNGQNGQNAVNNVVQPGINGHDNSILETSVDPLDVTIISPVRIPPPTTTTTTSTTTTVPIEPQYSTPPTIKSHGQKGKPTPSAVLSTPKKPTLNQSARLIGTTPLNPHRKVEGGVGKDDIHHHHRHSQQQLHPHTHTQQTSKGQREYHTNHANHTPHNTPNAQYSSLHHNHSVMNGRRSTYGTPNHLNTSMGQNQGQTDNQFDKMNLSSFVPMSDDGYDHSMDTTIYEDSIHHNDAHLRHHQHQQNLLLQQQQQQNLLRQQQQHYLHQQQHPQHYLIQPPNHLTNQLSNQLSNQLHYQLSNPPSNQLPIQLPIQLSNQLSNQLPNQLSNPLSIDHTHDIANAGLQTPQSVKKAIVSQKISTHRTPHSIIERLKEEKKVQRSVQQSTQKIQNDQDNDQSSDGSGEQSSTSMSSFDLGHGGAATSDDDHNTPKSKGKGDVDFIDFDDFGPNILIPQEEINLQLDRLEQQNQQELEMDQVDDELDRIEMMMTQSVADQDLSNNRSNDENNNPNDIVSNTTMGDVNTVSLNTSMMGDDQSTTNTTNMTNNTDNAALSTTNTTTTATTTPSISPELAQRREELRRQKEELQKEKEMLRQKWATEEQNTIVIDDIKLYSSLSRHDKVRFIREYYSQRQRIKVADEAKKKNQNEDDNGNDVVDNKNLRVINVQEIINIINTTTAGNRTPPRSTNTAMPIDGTTTGVQKPPKTPTKTPFKQLPTHLQHTFGAKNIPNQQSTSIPISTASNSTTTTPKKQEVAQIDAVTAVVKPSSVVKTPTRHEFREDNVGTEELHAFGTSLHTIDAKRVALNNDQQQEVSVKSAQNNDDSSEVSHVYGSATQRNKPNNQDIVRMRQAQHDMEDANNNMNKSQNDDYVDDQDNGNNDNYDETAYQDDVNDTTMNDLDQSFDIQTGNLPVYSPKGPKPTPNKQKSVTIQENHSSVNKKAKSAPQRRAHDDLDTSWVQNDDARRRSDRHGEGFDDMSATESEDEGEITKNGHNNGKKGYVDEYDQDGNLNQTIDNEIPRGHDGRIDNAQDDNDDNDYNNGDEEDDEEEDGMPRKPKQRRQRNPRRDTIMRLGEMPVLRRSSRKRYPVLRDYLGERVVYRRDGTRHSDDALPHVAGIASAIDDQFTSEELNERHRKEQERLEKKEQRAKELSERGGPSNQLNKITPSVVNKVISQYSDPHMMPLIGANVDIDDNDDRYEHFIRVKVDTMQKVSKKSKSSSSNSKSDKNGKKSRRSYDEETSEDDHEDNNDEGVMDVNCIDPFVNQDWISLPQVTETNDKTSLKSKKHSKNRKSSSHNEDSDDDNDQNNQNLDDEHVVRCHAAISAEDFGAGQIWIPPNTGKSKESVGAYHAFFIATGESKKIKVTIDRKSFKLSAGDWFKVPSGSTYGIFNESRTFDLRMIFIVRDYTAFAMSPQLDQFVTEDVHQSQSVQHYEETPSPAIVSKNGRKANEMGDLSEDDDYDQDGMLSTKSSRKNSTKSNKSKAKSTGGKKKHYTDKYSDVEEDEDDEGDDEVVIKSSSQKSTKSSKQSSQRDSIDDIDDTTDGEYHHKAQGTQTSQQNDDFESLFGSQFNQHHVSETNGVSIDDSEDEVIITTKNQSKGGKNDQENKNNQNSQKTTMSNGYSDESDDEDYLTTKSSKSTSKSSRKSGKNSKSLTKIDFDQDDFDDGSESDYQPIKSSKKSSKSSKSGDIPSNSTSGRRTSSRNAGKKSNYLVDQELDSDFDYSTIAKSTPNNKKKGKKDYYDVDDDDENSQDDDNDGDDDDEDDYYNNKNKDNKRKREAKSSKSNSKSSSTTAKRNYEQYPSDDSNNEEAMKKDNSSSKSSKDDKKKDKKKDNGDKKSKKTTKIDLDDYDMGSEDDFYADKLNTSPSKMDNNNRQFNQASKQIKKDDKADKNASVITKASLNPTSNSTTVNSKSLYRSGRSYLDSDSEEDPYSKSSFGSWGSQTSLSGDKKKFASLYDDEEDLF